MPEFESIAPNLYYDQTFDTDAAKILPGQFYATQRDMVIVTVLGSCVSACIRDPYAQVGGMNHFMLPNSGGQECSVSSSTRYGSFAMEVLINELIKMGARRDRLEAKLFGGANVVQSFAVNNIGVRNAEFATDYLKREHIKVVATDLLGAYPRKVYYFPETGRVLVKRLRDLHNMTIIEREIEYESRISGTDVGGDVELFG